MTSTTERRFAIIELLNYRRKETIYNLAFEFNVDRRTIERDIVILSCTFPLETKTGKGGGVYVPKWFHLTRRYLKFEELDYILSVIQKIPKEEQIKVLKILEPFCYRV